MISKKVPNPKKSASKSERVRGLADYILEPGIANGVEKCIYFGAEGFLTNTPEGHKAEMIALAEEAVKSRDPVDHWVLSYHFDEHPTQDQAREAVEMFIKHCGLENHQYIWGLHDDTKNKHIHIAVNRVNPATLRVTKINKGFDKEAGQQAIALIEHAHGWRKENNARYNIVNGKPVLSEKGEIAKNYGKPLEPSTHARDMELQTGIKSAQRLGIEQAAPIIQQSTSWKELHARFAVIGMQYERKGSGAIIFVDGVPVKASDVSRTASLTALQKRFGVYQSSEESRHIVAVTPDFSHLTSSQLNIGVNHVLRSSPDHGIPPDHIIHANRLAGNQFSHAANRASGLYELSDGGLDVDRQEAGMLLPSAVQEHLGNQQAGRNQDMRYAGASEASSRRYNSHTYTNSKGFRVTEQRLQLAATERRASGKHIQPLKENQPGWKEYQVIKAEQKASKNLVTIQQKKKHEAERNKLFEKHRAERTEIFKRNWRGKGEARNTMLSIVATKQAAEKLELQAQQREERTELQNNYKPLPQYKQWAEQPQIVAEFVRTISDLHTEKHNKSTALSHLLKNLKHTTNAAHQTTFRFEGKDMFRDEGKILAVLDPNSDKAIAAALATAQQKFGNTLTLTGSEEFKRRAVAVAVAENLTCKFQDPALDALRERLQAERYQAEREARQAVEREAQAVKEVAAAKEKEKEAGREAMPVSPALAPSNQTREAGASVARSGAEALALTAQPKQEDEIVPTTQDHELVQQATDKGEDVVLIEKAKENLLDAFLERHQGLNTAINAQVAVGTVVESCDLHAVLSIGRGVQVLHQFQSRAELELALSKDKDGKGKDRAS